MGMTDSLTYADAGVDIDKADKLIGTISEIASQTPRMGVIGEIGGFGGLFSPNLANLDRPVLVSSTDGVGTKLKIAFMLDKHDTVGIDLVAMSVNDMLVQGAEPLVWPSTTLKHSARDSRSSPWMQLFRIPVVVGRTLTSASW